MRRCRCSILPRILTVALAILLLFTARVTDARTITVNSTADTATDDGECTLREAITAANTSGSGNGISLFNNGGNLIEGNFFGTDASGTAAVPNEDDAINIELSSNGNTIGGTAPAARNVICGSEHTAFFIATSGNVVQGNFIGVGSDGVSPLGNQVGAGLVGVGQANDNLIGA